MNLAPRLLVDGFNGEHEQAVVVSNDVDFAGAMPHVREDLDLRVTLVNPDARNASPRDLAETSRPTSGVCGRVISTEPVSGHSEGRGCKTTTLVQ